jgi:hypothetical protein
MPLRRLTLLPFLAALAFGATPEARIDEKHRAFLKEYCVECHNADKQKGKLRLDDIPFTLDTVQWADRWQKILNQVNSGEMPPEEAKQPGSTAKADFLEMLSGTLVTARKSIGDSRGLITMRRLNRREYKNTLRDLLGVDLPVNELPADGGAGSFDTVGSSLFMSSDQFERYLALGRQAIDEHFIRFGQPTKALKVHLEAEDYATPRITKSYAGRVDCHDRYVAWTTAVDAAAAKPENVAIVAAIQAEKKGAQTHRYFEWKRIPGAPSPEKFGYIDEIHADQQGRRNWVLSAPQQRAYLDHPASKTGSFLTFADVFANPHQAFNVPFSWPAGKYTLRVRVAGTANTPKSRHFLEFGPLQGAVASTHEVTGTMEAPQLLEFPIDIVNGGSRGFFLRERGSFDSNERALEIFGEAHRRNGIGPEFALWIDWIEIFNTDNSPAAHKERREVELHANRMVGGTYDGYYKGGNEAAKAFLATGKPQKGIPDAQEAKFRVKVFGQHGPSFERYLNDPLTKTGAYLTIQTVHTEEVITLPPDQPSGWLKTKHEVESVTPGEYMLRFRIGAVKDAPKDRRFVELGSRKSGDKDFTLLQAFQVSGTTDEPQIIEVSVNLTTDSPRTFVLREKRDVKLDQALYDAAQKATGVGPPSALWIDWVEWEGPLKAQKSMTPSTSLLTANTQGLPERDHAREIIAKFALRAFRDKSPGAPYLDKLVALYDARRKAGASFESALKDPLSVILTSPGFLYLAEPNEEKTVRPLNDNELAVRLSYFLWSAPPDDTLVALARNGDLKKPAVLAREVDRMLASPKADEFVRGFVHQWLGLARLDFFQFDTKQYRDFDDSTKGAARQEVYETFAHLLRQKESLTKLIKNDQVYVNGLLANYYGLDGIAGDRFRTVNLPKDSPRGGLLGMAAILAMGSNGRDTSPVERGAWVLRKIMHEPPPPAPPNVPQLNRLENKILSTRERLAAHQEQPQCAQCHRKIDPIGFGFENFNAAGKWRASETYEKKGVGSKTWPIDPAGAFYKGAHFKDYFELRDQLASKPEKFARGFSEALVEYGMGRPFGFLDEPLAVEMITEARSQDYQMAAFIRALVLSKTFQTK